MKENITIRISKNQAAALQGAAAIKNMTLSTLVEKLIEKEMKENGNGKIN